MPPPSWPLIATSFTVALLALVNSVTGYFYSADASYFLFEGLSTGTATLAIDTYPQRAAAMGATLGPAVALGHWTGSTAWPLAAYPLCYAAPSWAACWALWRLRSAMPPSAVLCLALLLGPASLAPFGFPTETVCTAAAVAGLIMALHRADATAGWLGWVLGLWGALVLSHEAWLVAWPGLLALASRLHQQRDLSTRCWRWFVAASVMALLAWASVEHWAGPDAVAMTGTLRANSRNLIHTGESALARLALGAAALTLLAAFWKPLAQRPMAMMGAWLAWGALATQALALDTPTGHYLARGALILLMGLTPWVCALRRPVQPQAWQFLALALLAMLVVHACAAWRWTAVRERLAQEAIRGVVFPDANADWAWARPYQWALFTQPEQRHPGLFAQRQPWGPLPCHRVSGNAAYRRLLSPAEHQALAQQVCASEDLARQAASAR